MDGDPKPAAARPAVPSISGEPQLPVLRFGLRQFFWWITAACVLLAVLAAIPRGMSLLALVLAVSVVSLHVLSTAIGTRLREHANQRREWESGQNPGLPSVDTSHSTAMVEPARRSPLHGHDQPLRRMRICLTVGAVVGGLVGIAALSLLLGNRTTIAGIVVGAASTAVVGAWIAFVAASAWSIFRQGWRDAVRDANEK